MARHLLLLLKARRQLAIDVIRNDDQMIVRRHGMAKLVIDDLSEVHEADPSEIAMIRGGISRNESRLAFGDTLNGSRPATSFGEQRGDSSPVSRDRIFFNYHYF
jgi:hypothetical protein